IPPVAVSYWTFRLMIGAGIVMALLALYGLYLMLSDKIERNVLYLRLLVWAVVLPYLANTTGWLFTEIARQPWIVFGLQTVDQAVSPNVSGGMVLFSLIGFAVLYGALMAADLYLLVKFAKSGPADEDKAEAVTAPTGTPAGAMLK
ncbi:MAG: cytochrome ubiquinol oxidase subunit I, partial [Chloroflexota bacterium]